MIDDSVVFDNGQSTSGSIVPVGQISDIRWKNMEEQIARIGPKSREMLRAAGIVSIKQLQEMGSVAAYVKVKRAGCRPSLNFLWGLESAISGEHWRDIAKNHRTALLLAVDELERDQTT
jgi:DNA transformation protein